MERIIFITLIIFISLSVLSQGRICTGSDYRFDYEYSSQAGGWWKFHFIPATWREARLRCHAEGAVLASPLNVDMKAAMISMAAQRKKTPDASPFMIFTGVHATFSKGDYSSIEGVPLLRLSIAWAEGEPDNYNDTESCLAMLTNDQGSMSDESCARVLPYICYKPGPKSYTLNECGTIDSEYKLEPKTGNCYKFHWRGRPWRVAYMICVAEGGHLVTIDSQEELDVIKEIQRKHPYSSTVSTSKTIGTGFHDWGEHTFFMTIHGENLENDFNTWSTNEPNNMTNTRSNDAGEFCGSIWNEGKLNDLLCGITVPFICEKKPDSLL